MAIEIPLKGKYCGGGPGRRSRKGRGTTNQLQASVRKKRNKAERLATNTVEAKQLDIAVDELRFRRAKELAELLAEQKREAARLARDAREWERESPYGRRSSYWLRR